MRIGVGGEGGMRGSFSEGLTGKKGVVPVNKKVDGSTSSAT